MAFSSFEFLIAFFPIFFVVYLSVLRICRKNMLLPNLILFIGSFIFYFYGSSYYSLVLIALAVITYFLALGINKARTDEKRGVAVFLLVMLILINFSVLLSYKLFFDGTLIGVGFYTLQLISYGIDVFQNRIDAERNIIKLLTFSVLFSKLIQGPFARYGNIQYSLDNRAVSLGRFDKGLKLFIFGLAMKVCLADKISCLWNDLAMIGYESISTKLAWMGAFAYSFQLYFDFYGYSLMAMGLGEMTGIRLPSNFSDPYFAKSVGEFYRKWHITLGYWFRDYIYIPLGGNRKGKLKTYVNLFIVWLATTFWHGISWHYLIWGMSLFFFIALEKLFLDRLLKKTHVIPHLYIWFVIPLTWVAFAITDIKQLGIYFARLFPFLSSLEPINVNPSDYIKYGKLYGVLFIISIVLCIPCVNRFLIGSRRKWWSGILAFVLFLISMYYISLGTGNPFMYLQF